MFMGDSLETGLLEAPGDGKIAWATHADLAEAAAVILADAGRYDGPTPPLTGSQALDFTDLTALASEVLGRQIVHKVFPDDELGARMGGAARHMLGMFLASHAGEFAPADPTLEQLLGRPPISVREVIAQKVSS